MLIPQRTNPVRLEEVILPDELVHEEECLAEVRRLVSKENLEKGDFVSWAAYHSSHQVHNPEVTLSDLLSLLYENAHTVVVVKPGMEIIRRATHHVV